MTRQHRPLTTSFSVRIPLEQYRQIIALATAEHRTVNMQISYLVEIGLTHYDQRPRPAPGGQQPNSQAKEQAQ